MHPPFSGAFILHCHLLLLHYLDSLIYTTQSLGSAVKLDEVAALQRKQKEIISAQKNGIIFCLLLSSSQNYPFELRLPSLIFDRFRSKICRPGKVSF